jgi:hypothetical protein
MIALFGFFGFIFICFVSVLIFCLMTSESCEHEFVEVNKICTSTQAAYICKKCGKIKKVKLK